MAFIVKGLVSDGTLPTSAKQNLAADIATPASTVRAALDAAGLGAGASDADIAAFVQDETSATGTALSSTFALKGEAGTNALNLMPGLSQVAKAQSGPFRIQLSGTSIANNSNSALKTMAEWLITQHGDSGAVISLAGALGGSVDAPYSGWSRQPYGGPKFIRFRGAAGTAQAFNVNGYGDQVVIEWSRETDGVAFDIEVDGTVVGSVGGAGTQLYGQRTTFTVDKGPHRVRVLPPATGYAYLEGVEVLDTARKGMEVRDATLGGSSIRDMVTLKAPTGQQVAGIPVAGDNGIDAYFNRTDVDLHLVSYVVNDAGGGTTWASGGYKDAVDKIVAKTRTRGVPVVFVVEMAGHYSLEANTANHAAFNTIREYLLAQAAHPHVTVVDWHAATILEDKQLYMSRYYSATNLNVGAGTFTGDFIHPNKAAYRVLEGQLAQVLPSSQPRRELPSQIANDRLRTIPPGGFDQLATVGGALKRYAAPAGAAYKAVSAGLTSYFQGVRTHYYRDTAVTNVAATTQTAINASANSDQWGPYNDYATSGVGLGSTVDWVGGEKCYLTVRASGTVRLRADGAVSFFSGGAEVPDTDTVNGRCELVYVVGAGVEPLVFTVEIGSTAASQNVYITGRVYEVSITRTTVPVLV